MERPVRAGRYSPQPDLEGLAFGPRGTCGAATVMFPCGRCHVTLSFLSARPHSLLSAAVRPARIGSAQIRGNLCKTSAEYPDSGVLVGKNFSAARVIPAQRDVFAEAGATRPGPETGRYRPPTGAGFKGLWRRVCEKQTAQNSRKSLKEMEKTSGVVFSVLRLRSVKHRPRIAVVGSNKKRRFDM